MAGGSKWGGGGLMVWPFAAFGMILVIIGALGLILTNKRNESLWVGAIGLVVIWFCLPLLAE